MPFSIATFLQRASNCLLYTSDAADEEDSVDLGGRRIYGIGALQSRRTMTDPLEPIFVLDCDD